MQVVTDLHSHSKYARAVSSQMVLPVISEWCQRKGIDIVSTGDWTHPLWFKELETQLEEKSEGLYQLKSGQRTLFLLSTEVAAIYSQGGKTRRIHLLIFAPSFEVARKINLEFTKRRLNLFSDGRPILGLSARDILEIVLGVDERVLVIPAHAWTPWFSLYGSMSGFDSIEECFGDLANYIYGIETGLSSDPAMNWRVEDLKNRSILSFSDAHSPAKLGRELTVFELVKLGYGNIRQAIVGGGQDKIAYTVEFYPEEGKYHYTGHRDCGIKHSPQDSKELGIYCPKCSKPLTVGVMHRVEELACGMSNDKIQRSNDEYGVKWVKSRGGQPKYAMLVPLLEILSEAIGAQVSSQRVINEYKKLTDSCENELTVLMKTKPEAIERISGSKIREGVEKVRRGDIVIDPGYDNEYGVVKIWNKGKKDEVAGVEREKEQITLF